MRVLVTGHRGLLGQPLIRRLERARHTTLGIGQAECDVTDASAVATAVSQASPEVVVHLAAFTAVDRCESEPDTATAVNVHGTANVARAAETAGAIMVALSTDYVFDGAHNAPYVETDAVNPLSVYGRTKLAGEEAVRRMCSRYAVVRSAWLFGVDGPNFVDTILRRVQSGGQVHVVDDQVGSPTATEDLAQGLVSVVEARAQGTYHIAGGGAGSWYDLARTAVSAAGLDTGLVQSMDTASLARPALRPAYSALDCTKARDALAVDIRPWSDALQDYIQARGNRSS